MFLNSDSFDSIYYETLVLLNQIFVFFNKRIRSAFPHFELNAYKADIAIDILIPAIEKDIRTLPLVVEGVRKNVFQKIQNIYVISNSEIIKKLCYDIDCDFINEDNVLPIRKCDIDYKVNGKDRSGWIFQQFLKLYGDSICESENFLVIDADTVLIRPTVFNTANITTFFYSDEFNVTYFRCLEKIFHQKPTSFRSYVSHMMLFNREVLYGFRKQIENIHEKSWYDAILESMEKNHIAAFSEFESYGNYFRQKWPYAISHRYWHNKQLQLSAIDNLEDLEKKYCDKYRSLSFHVYP